MKAQKLFLLTIGLLMVLFLVGCTKAVTDVKTEDMVGKTVSLRGEVSGVIKIGQLSGYTLTDKSGDSIPVASKELPAEGDTVTIKGIVEKNPLFGYYIDVDKKE